MKRRDFIRSLGLTAAAMTMPALAAKIAATPVADVLTLEKLKKAVVLLTGAPRFYYRPDINAWIGHAVSHSVQNDEVYEFATRFDEEPDELRRRMFVQVAEVAFQRAKRKLA